MIQVTGKGQMMGCRDLRVGERVGARLLGDRICDGPQDAQHGGEDEQRHFRQRKQQEPDKANPKLYFCSPTAPSTPANPLLTPSYPLSGFLPDSRDSPQLSLILSVQLIDPCLPYLDPQLQSHKTTCHFLSVPLGFLSLTYYAFSIQCPITLILSLPLPTFYHSRFT